jgi:hypothetical protein
MTRIKCIILLVAVCLLIPSYVVAMPAYDNGDIEAEGLVESFEPSTGELIVGGTTFWVNEETLVITGRGRGTLVELSKQIVGQWVDVSGYVDEDGKVIAQKVRIKSWINTESETDPDDDDDTKLLPLHPIALWMAKKFDLDYDELMAMHEAGVGWGNIVKAYHMAQANPALDATGEELLDMRLEGKGWGNITRELGSKPGKAPPAWGLDKDRPHPNPNAGPKK